MVIENFAELSFEEQKKFADALVKTINSERIFTDDTNFELDNVEVDELTGGLVLSVSHPDPIKVSREATWTCGTKEEVSDDPGYDADYKESIYKDIEKAFKTLSTVIDGYEVSLQIDDLDSNEAIEVNVDSYTHEDNGIGHYEFWGERGYDSRPYVEVEGTIVVACDCAISLWIEPEDTTEATEEPDAE